MAKSDWIRALLLAALIAGCKGTPEGSETASRELSKDDCPANKWACEYGQTENPGRDGKPVTLWTFEAVNAAEGLRIADVGAGTGYFTFKLAKIVGPKGRVLATETDPDMVARLNKEVAQRGTANVSTHQVASYEDPGLGKAALDVILLVDVDAFHSNHGDRRPTLLRAYRDALRPGGRLVLVQQGLEPTRGDTTVEDMIAMAAVEGLVVSYRHNVPRGGETGDGYVLGFMAK